MRYQVQDTVTSDDTLRRGSKSFRVNEDCADFDTLKIKFFNDCRDIHRDGSGQEEKQFTRICSTRARSFSKGSAFCLLAILILFLFGRALLSALHSSLKERQCNGMLTKMLP